MKIMPNTVKNPEISIVIPVYNVERFLRKCLETLEAQTSQSFEIIAVNDGSPDGCLKILQELECDAIQGFHFYHPVPDWEAEEKLRAEHGT